MTAQQPIPSFRHDPLPNPKRYIRLLEVISLDESRQIPVHCHLTTWSVKDAPLYLAVSYTWGDRTDTIPIVVNKKRLYVSRNCEYVLKQAKWYGDLWMGCYLWCDAICIDQSNKDEKGHQVFMMGDIYRDAERVVACVGEHRDSSNFLFRALRRGSDTRALVAHLSSANDPLAWDISRMRRDRRVVMLRLLAAVGSFLKRAYFSRTWIYQELFLGRDVTMLCGGDRAAMRTLLNLADTLLSRLRWGNVSLLELRDDGSKAAGALIRAKDKIQEKEHLLRVGAGTIQRKTLKQLLIDVLPLQCQDPRDNIFGILALVDWGDQEDQSTVIYPDYTRNAFDLGRDILKLIGVTLSHARLVADNLKLAPSFTPAMITQARRRRHRQAVRTQQDFNGPSLQLTTTWPDTGWSALRCQNTGQDWHFDLAPQWIAPLELWPVDHRRNGHSNSSNIPSVPTNLILPQNLRSGDWCLFPKPQDGVDDTYTLVLVARRPDTYKNSPMQIVGRGFVLSSCLKTWPISRQRFPDICVYWGSTGHALSLALASTWVATMDWADRSLDAMEVCVENFEEYGAGYEDAYARFPEPAWNAQLVSAKQDSVCCPANASLARAVGYTHLPVCPFCTRRS